MKHPRTIRRLAARVALLGGSLYLSIGTALATTTGGLPWDIPISTLQNDLTGPVATGISVIAFLAAGAALVFGEELGGIAKKALFVVLGVAMIVLGNNFLIFSLAQVWAAVLGIVLWIVGQWALALAAKYDPLLSRSGIRHLHYARHYPAAASPFAPDREVK